MNKKGFTLIELLGTIVVIAIIAIITVPTILGVIERARKASYKDSVYGIIESARIYLANNIGNYNENNEIEFICNGKTCSNNKDSLSFKGNVPKSGSIYIKGDGTILVESLYNGRYYANNETGEVVITDNDSTMTRGELTEIVKGLQNEIKELKSKSTFLEGTNVNQQSELDVLKVTVNKIQSHVGMIIQSTTLNTEDKVKAVYGGTTWTKIEGRFLIGSSSKYTVNSTGGEETVTLTIAQMPKHAHTIGSQGVVTNPVATNGGGAGWTKFTGSAQATRTDSAGSGSPHNNMPPYKAVYIWERTK